MQAMQGAYRIGIAPMFPSVPKNHELSTRKNRGSRGIRFWQIHSSSNPKEMTGITKQPHQ